MPAPNASGFNMALGIILLFLGVMVGFIGIMGVIGEGLNGIGWLMLLMGMGGVLMVVGGLQMVRDGNTDRKKQANAAQAARSGQALAVLPDILAEWVLDEQTWKDFCINEKKYRNQDNLWFFVAFLFLGTIVLMISRSSSFLLAISIVGAIGLITIYLRRTVALQKLHVPAGMPKQVVIGRRHILMNGKIYPINADRMTTRKVRVIEDSTPMLLELTLYWPTRNGETYDELRIPVPPPALEKAKLAANGILPGHSPELI